MTAIKHIPSVDRRDFVARFLNTRIDKSSGAPAVVIPKGDEVVLSANSEATVSAKMALQTAEKIQELGAAGMWGALPVVVSAAILQSVWKGDSEPFFAQPLPADDPKVIAQYPEGFVEQEKARQMDVINSLSASGGEHDVRFLLNGVDSPASASGDEVWLNLFASAQVFRSKELLAFAVAHEKGHIENGDTTWEPSGTALLWEVLEEAEASATNEAERATLNKGLEALNQSFAANAQLNELDADLLGLQILEEAGYDRVPGLAFLYNTVGDQHHPPGPHRVEMLRRQLEGTDRAFTAEELQRIKAQKT